MRYISKQDKYVLRLEKGEKIVEILLQFVEKHKLKAGHFTAIGALSWVELAHYSLINKKYSSKRIEVPLEIVSLIGNLTMFNGKPMLHAHINISDKEMRSYGGHLKEGEVSATCEIMFIELPFGLVRKHDDEIGLNLMDI